MNGVMDVGEVGSGPDAFAFTNLLTCRDLTTCEVGQCKYVLITARRGGIVNDPVLLRLEEDRFWLALADSDALLYAKGVAAFAGLDVDIREADVAPMQGQGSRPASSTTGRTSVPRTPRSTSRGSNGSWSSIKRPTSSGRTRCAGSRPRA